MSPLHCDGGGELIAVFTYDIRVRITNPYVDVPQLKQIS